MAFGFGFRMIKFKKPIEIGSLKLEERERMHFQNFNYVFFSCKLPNAKKTEFKKKLNGRMCLDVLGSNVKTFFTVLCLLNQVSTVSSFLKHNAWYIMLT